MVTGPLHELAAGSSARAAQINRLYGYASGEGQEPATGQDVNERSRTTTAAGEPLRILIIEDNRDYADGLSMVFELYGHTASAAYDGARGLEAALQSPPDVIVCDIGLPELDGYAVARAVRADARTAGICMVAVTGYGSEKDRQLAQAAGFDIHLTKPAEARDILVAIAAARSRQR